MVPLAVDAVKIVVDTRSYQMTQTYTFPADKRCATFTSFFLRARFGSLLHGSLRRLGRREAGWTWLEDKEDAVLADSSGDDEESVLGETNVEPCWIFLTILI